MMALLALGFGCSSPAPAPSPNLPAASTSISIASAAPAPDLPESPPDAREISLAEAATALLSKEHVLRKPIDDKLSKEAFPKYIEELDGAKMLLLESDVTALSRYEESMDDELRAGDLSLGRKGSALVATRRTAAAKMVADILSKPFDFTANETIETDPKKRSYSKSESELRDRWRGTLKLQALERIQQMEELLDAKNKPKPTEPDAGKGRTKDKDKDKTKEKDADDAKREAAAQKALASIPATFEGREEKVRKELAVRYSTRFTRLAASERLQPAEDFINAINAVFDPHTQYMAPSEEANFDIAITGKLEGIGAALGEQDHFVVVNDLIPGGASWQQGKLEAGDLILAVAQEGKDPVDVTDMPLDKVVEMIRGPKGTVVNLTVKKADGHMETISITRDVIHIEATYARGAILHLDKKKDPIGYVYLPGFYGDIGGRGKPGERNATDDVRAILVALSKKKVGSIILDLRGNGGGLLSHARDISGLFIEKGPVVQTRDADGKIEVLSDTDPSVTFSGNVVVMVDRFSASAAEILAGALQDYERAVVVGTSSTHGKGTVQAVVDLDRLRKGKAGDPLGIYKITMQEYFRVSGGSTQLRGVTPDVLLPDPASFIESGERTLFHPIPWSTIAPAQFTKTPHSWDVTSLQAASQVRTRASAELSKVEAFGKIVGARRDKTLEPLERKAWQEERKREKAELDAADPKLKDQKPLLEIEALADPSAPPAPTDPKLRKRLDSWKDDLSRDPWVEESVHVLDDMSKKH